MCLVDWFVSHLDVVDQEIDDVIANVVDAELHVVRVPALQPCM
jgi:hypothetical protein